MPKGKLKKTLKTARQQSKNKKAIEELEAAVLKSRGPVRGYLKAAVMPNGGLSLTTVAAPMAGTTAAAASRFGAAAASATTPVEKTKASSEAAPPPESVGLKLHDVPGPGGCGPNLKWSVFSFCHCPLCTSPRPDYQPPVPTRKEIKELSYRKKMAEGAETFGEAAAILAGGKIFPREAVFATLVEYLGYNLPYYTHSSEVPVYQRKLRQFADEMLLRGLQEMICDQKPKTGKTAQNVKHLYHFAVEVFRRTSEYYHHYYKKVFDWVLNFNRKFHARTEEQKKENADKDEEVLFDECTLNETDFHKKMFEHVKMAAMVAHVIFDLAECRYILQRGGYCLPALMLLSNHFSDWKVNDVALVNRRIVGGEALGAAKTALYCLFKLSEMDKKAFDYFTYLLSFSRANNYGIYIRLYGYGSKNDADNVILRNHEMNEHAKAVKANTVNRTKKKNEDENKPIPAASSIQAENADAGISSDEEYYTMERLSRYRKQLDRARLLDKTGDGFYYVTGIDEITSEEEEDDLETDDDSSEVEDDEQDTEDVPETNKLEPEPAKQVENCEIEGNTICNCCEFCPMNQERDKKDSSSSCSSSSSESDTDDEFWGKKSKRSEEYSEKDEDDLEFEKTCEVGLNIDTGDTEIEALSSQLIADAPNSSTEDQLS